MPEAEVFQCKGKVVQGHQIASGMSPTGKDGLNATVVKQLPFFIKEGVPVGGMFGGTVNVNLLGNTFEITKPEHVITCEWHPGIVETFWLVPAELKHKDLSYKGFVYFPLPSAIQTRNKEVMELLMPEVSNLSYGDDVEVVLPGRNLDIFALPA